MKMLKGDSAPSEYRKYYNDWITNNVKGIVLDVGKSTFWDYSDTPYEYKTIDTNKRLEPDFVGDICRSSLCSGTFDFVLCNGLRESVKDPQKMIDEVQRLLTPGGTAIFGFVGKGYKPYKKDWGYYDGSEKFFGEIVIKNFGDKYHFIICKKI